MRKIFIFLGIMVISFVMVGCTTGNETKVAPTYTGLRIEETNPIDGSDFVTFYRGKQESVEVEIKLSNPDNLTIKSVVINGITYNSHRFLDKSTFSAIYFDMLVGDVLGETVYSVDKISYLDGENTKNIEGFSNNEFSVYVYKDLPSVDQDTYSPTKESIQIEFDVVDVDSVIDVTTLRAELYNGQSLEQTIDMVVGKNTVLFEGLLSNKFYDIKVVASYDLDDTNGVQQNTTLYSESYLTFSNINPGATIKNQVVNSTDVTIDVDYLDEDNVLLPGRLRAVLYQGDTEIDTVWLSGSQVGVKFDDLFNNTEYTIEILADYNLQSGEGEQIDQKLDFFTFTTPARSIPVPQIVGLNLLENTIEFGIEITDPFDVIFEDSLYVKLYVDGELVNTQDLFLDESYKELYDINHYNVGLFIGELFADSVIEIEIRADVYLNDGDPAQVIQSDVNLLPENLIYSTSINPAPTIQINSMLVEQGYMTLFINASDPNSTLKQDFTIILYEEGVEIQRKMFGVDETQIVFEYASKSELQYQFEILATYDLRDGYGRQNDVLLTNGNYYGKEDKAPIAEISNEQITTDSITFDVRIIDADETIVASSVRAYLYLDGVLIATSDSLIIGTQQVVFADGSIGVTFEPGKSILSNTEYDIVIKADYDLQIRDDENGVEQIENIVDDQINDNVAYMTVEKETPVAIFSERTIENRDITVKVDVTDLDDVIVPGSIQVVLRYKDGAGVEQEVIITLDPLNQAQFTNLFADHKYTIEIIALLDYNDGVVNTEKEVIYSEIFFTEQYNPPNVQVSEIRSSDTTIEIDLETTDIDNTYQKDLLGNNTLKAIAYDGNVEVASTTFALITGARTITIENLDPETEYHIIIEATVDLRTVAGEIENYVLYSDYKFTEESPAPTENLISFVDETIGKSTATFTIEVIDDEDLFTTSHLTVTLKQYNDETVFTYIIATNTVTNLDLTNLLSNNDYELTITGTYDYNGVTDIDYEYVHTFTTEALELPSVNINSVSEWTSAPDFTIDVLIATDSDNVANDQEWYAVLYEDGVAVTSVNIYDINTANPEGTTTTVVFSGYDHTAAHTYTVVITAALQLHELDPVDDPLYQAETTTAMTSRTYINAGN